MEDINAKIAQLSLEKQALLEKLLQQKKLGKPQPSDGARLTPPTISRRSYAQTTPLSFAQQRLWFLQRLEPDSCSYYTPIALKIKGFLHIEALRQSFSTVIERHESLRTQFNIVDELPVQVISQSWNFELPLIDLSNLSRQEQSINLPSLLHEESKRPFDLTVDLMLRATLIGLSEDEHILVIVMHHIASDGWSRGILSQEISILYQSFAEIKTHLIPELPIQYADFALWQRQWLQGDILTSQLSYWKKQLGSNLPILQLPTDHPRLPIQTDKGASISLELSQDLTNALKTLSRREGVTLFMTLLAAFQVLLHHYSGQEDIIVGTAIANRNHQEIEKLIGFFANTLALKISFQNNPSFKELLKIVKEVCLGAYSHQDLPFEKLVEEIQPERSLSHSPIFQVMFVLQNTPPEAISFADLIVESIELESQTTKFDLTLSLTESPTGLFGKWEYSTDLFNRATIERMSRHFQVLLAGIVADPDIEITRLPILTEKETHQLLIEWNDTFTEYPLNQCIHQLFEEQVERTPENIAVVFEDQELTYRELNNRANQLAHHLQTLGVKPETLVGICVERSLEMLLGILGILKAGGAYVPLDPSNPKDRLEYILDNVQAQILVTQSALLNIFPVCEKIVCFDTDAHIIDQYPTTKPISSVNKDNLAYIIYTSGSTGKPKGVLVSHYNVVRLFTATDAWYHFNETDVWTMFHSFAFDFSVWEIWGALCYGGSVVVISYLVSRDTEAFYNLLIAEKVTVLNQTPSAFYQLIEADERSQNREKLNLRLIIFGGEALNLNNLLPWFERHGDQKPQLVNMYGITETTVHVTYRPLTLADVKATGSLIGRPIPDLQIYLLDQYRQLVPIGVPGEMYVGGAGVAQGYWQRDELTRERFISHPFSSDPNARLYKTGDLARYLVDGNIEYIGRIDHQVKIRGFRIELGEIEVILNQHPDISNAVAIVREDNPGDKRIIAYILTEDQAILIQAELRQFLKQKLPGYMIPSVFVTLEIFPITPNGKVDRRALPKPELLRETKFISPSSLTEEIIILIWSNLLGISAISQEDNFFEIGGHSILATQVISRLQEAFKQEIPIKTLFEYPTPAELAKVIEQKYHPEKDLTIIEPLNKRENLPLSFAQLRMWFLYQLEEKSATYNVSFALRLEGELNQSSLEKAFCKIIERHEILRTSFIAIDGLPVQVITPALNFALSVIDLEEQRQIEELVKTEVNLPFDLTVSPLFRAKILRLTKTSHILLIAFHHIIIDGWSMGVFHSELSTLYQDFNNDKSSSLPPLTIQYADFAQWQRNWLQGEVLESQLSYWQEQLGGILPILQLPTDYPRPPIQTYNGASVSVEISPVLTNQLKVLSQQEGVTLFMTLLAAFQTLLYRYSGQEDIIVGTAIANRNRQEIESLIGFFVNTLAMRINFANYPSFQELLIKAKEICLDAYSHQDIPFEKLVEELQQERNLSHNPIFQVIFILQNTPQETINLAGLKIEQINLKSQTTKVDLTLSLTETTNGLMGTWQYNTDLFADATINRMSEHFQQLLTEIVANPQISVTNLSIITDRERHQLLIEWNNTITNYPQEKTIHQLFEEQVERTPENIAIVFEDQELTYRELNNRANQLAHHLQTLGVKPEILVGIYVERSLEMIVGILGILKAGGAYVPLDPTYPTERLQFIVDDTQTPILLTQYSLLEKLPLDKIHVVCIDAHLEKINYESQDNPNSNAIATNLSYIIYTSGSTGKPKGVCAIHRGVVRLVQNTNYANLNSAQTFLQLAPLAFDASTFEIWGSLLNGARLVIFPPHPPALKELGQVIQRYQITTLWLTSGLFHLMVDEHIEDLKPVRQLLAGGDVLSIPHVQKVLSTLENCQLINGYGPTEGTTFTCTHLISEVTQFSNSVSIGRPVSNTQVYILDRYMQPVSIGVSGEIYIGGDGLARGYLNQPELTAEKFIVNPFGEGKLYKSGDLACYLTDGNIEFLGRNDNQVKIRGFRIELGEIEAVLGKHPNISNAVAIVREDITGDKRIIAYVVPKTILTNNELREYLKTQLPEYMIPSTSIFLDRLPLTINGKVDRNALPDPDSLDSSVTSSKFILPRNSTEQQLAAIWEEHLNYHPISIHDNFFDLGGHSLLSIRLVSAIEKAFNCTLPLMSFFQLSTIEELALWLRQHEQETIEVLSGLTLEYYRDLLAHSAGRQGNHLGKRGLIVEVSPDIDNTDKSRSQPFVWIGDIEVAKNLRLQQPIYVMPTFSRYSCGYFQEDCIKTEAIASLLVDELLTVHTSDSFMLGGYCYEGLVAMEMADQLKKLGKEITMLVLLEVYPPKPTFPYKFFTQFDKYLSTIRLHFFQLIPLSIPDKWNYLMDWINKHQNPEIQSELNSGNTSIADMGSKNYICRPYNDSVLLFMGTKRIRFIVEEKPLFYFDFSWLFPYFGFERFLKGNVKVIKIPCGHDITSEQNIEYVSPILDQNISSVGKQK